MGIIFFLDVMIKYIFCFLQQINSTYLNDVLSIEGSRRPHHVEILAGIFEICGMFELFLHRVSVCGSFEILVPFLKFDYFFANFSRILQVLAFLRLSASTVLVQLLACWRTFPRRTVTDMSCVAKCDFLVNL